MAEVEKKQKRRLGKGLGSLLAKPVAVRPPKEQSAGSGGDQLSDLHKKSDTNEPASLRGEDFSAAGLYYVDISSVYPNPHQPRQVFDDEGLTALANSIEKAGLMQPIVVRKSNNDNRYEIVAGERRWRAAQLAGLKKLPAILKELDDKTSAEWALIENLQREDLNPIDRAEAFDRLVVQFSSTQKEIANQLGIDRSSVANFLRLNDLEDFAKDAVRDGRLSMGHAKVLLGVPDLTTSKALARRCASEQWSVRELEKRIKQQGKKTITPQDQDPLEMFMKNLSDQLGEHLGTEVSINLGKKKGSGKLSITFYDNDQFEGILEQFNFKPKS